MSTFKKIDEERGPKTEGERRGCVRVGKLCHYSITESEGAF